MLGDGRLRNSGAAGQRMYRLLAIPRQPLKDRPAGRVGERSENVIGELRHGQTITVWLLFVKIKFSGSLCGYFPVALPDRQKMEFPASSCYLHSMEITVNIPDEVAEKARALGMTPESYVEGLVHLEKPEETLTLSVEERVADMKRFIEELSAHSENIPVLPDYAFTRESFYNDHD